MNDELTITPEAIPAGRRRSVYASTKLLHEWSLLQPWDEPPKYELRLGPTPASISNPSLTPVEQRMVRVANRYADLVGPIGNELLVVEAKMDADPGAQSQLLHYVDLLSTTPYFDAHRDKRIVPVLLFAANDPVVTQRAVAAGIRVEHFAPDWAREWFVKRYSTKHRIGF